MLLPKLREKVLEANLELVRRGLVLYTFGNASGISREDSLVVIKPSGVPYDTMKLEHLVVTDLHGKIIEGNLRPSSDLATHLVLYKAFPKIGGISHTHSEYATAWALTTARATARAWNSPPAPTPSSNSQFRGLLVAQPLLAVRGDGRSECPHQKKRVVIPSPSDKDGRRISR